MSTLQVAPLFTPSVEYLPWTLVLCCLIAQIFSLSLGLSSTVFSFEMTNLWTYWLSTWSALGKRTFSTCQLEVPFLPSSALWTEHLSQPALCFAFTQRNLTISTSLFGSLLGLIRQHPILFQRGHVCSQAHQGQGLFKHLDTLCRGVD